MTVSSIGGLVVAGLIAATAQAFAASPCPRPASGAVIAPPPDLYSQDGVLKVTLDYVTTTDSDGRTLYCYQTPDGLQSPTLHVNPGDRLQIALRDQVPEPASAAAPKMAMDTNVAATCGATTMDTTSVNIHFHGLNVAPRCHMDEVIHTLVNSGQSFVYSLQIPTDEPPGLYWYHPHVHGMSEAAVLGGASGAIEVEGIANLQPAVVGLPQRYLVIRDQIVPGAVFVNEPGWDISLNYVPINYPQYQPSIIQMQPGQKEFWRVLNADADTIMDLVLVYDQKVQKLQIVALDGVALGSQNGTQQGRTQTVDHILIPPAGRAEFIVTGPASGVASAYFATRKIETGQAGDNDPARPLAVIRPTGAASVLPVLQAGPRMVAGARFPDLATAAVTGHRLLYFSEDFTDARNPPGLKKRFQPDSENFFFYITVEGQLPALFNPANPPAITTHQGAVEDWVIQNQTLENHEFHIHQIHFLLMQRNRKTLPPAQQTMLDTVNVPAWSGEGPYPSVTLRMDFRGQVAGDFVYHCHILGHEDHGMMATIRVLPKA